MYKVEAMIIKKKYFGKKETNKLKKGWKRKEKKKEIL